MERMHPHIRARGHHRHLYGRPPFDKDDATCAATDRLQFYIRPVTAGESLLALMDSADPRLIPPQDSKSGTLIQAWRVTV